jgi:anti-sigma regulatory factor (Ser/Thr protein kinase)
MNAERSLPAVPESISEARRIVAEAFPTLPLEQLQLVQLMTSELATNCVLHAGSHYQIKLEGDERRIRVQVTDTASGDIELRSPASTDPHGRGLRIVDALADEWGVTPAIGRTGKSVWFTVAIPVDVPAAGRA